MIAWQFADAGMEHKKPQNKNSIDDKINDDVTNYFNTSIFLRKLYLVNFNEDIFLSQTLFHNCISQFTYSWQYFNSSDIFFLNVFFFLCCMTCNIMQLFHEIQQCDYSRTL